MVKLSGGLLYHTQLWAEAFWLSILSPGAIAAIDDYHYRKSKRYLNNSFNTSMLNDWEQDMVNRFFGTCQSILVLGSGGGREVYALAKQGFEIDGYECNKSLVESSQQMLHDKGIDASIEWVAPSHAPLNGKIYDGIILGWGAYIHVKGKENRIQLIKEMGTHIKSGAPLLISYWFANSRADAYCRKLYKTNKFFSRLFFTKPIEKGDRLAPISGRYFTHEETEQELMAGGFKVILQAASPYGHSVAVKI